MTLRSEYTVIYNEFNATQLPEGMLAELEALNERTIEIMLKYNIDPRDMRLLIEEDMWLSTAEYIIRNSYEVIREHPDLKNTRINDLTIQPV